MCVLLCLFSFVHLCVLCPAQLRLSWTSFVSFYCPLDLENNRRVSFSFLYLVLPWSSLLFSFTGILNFLHNYFLHCTNKPHSSYTLHPSVSHFSHLQKPFPLPPFSPWPSPILLFTLLYKGILFIRVYPCKVSIQTNPSTIHDILTINMIFNGCCVLLISFCSQIIALLRHLSHTLLSSCRIPGPVCHTHILPFLSGIRTLHPVIESPQGIIPQDQLLYPLPIPYNL